MKRLFRRAVAGLLLGAIVVLGGGFASADYSAGDTEADTFATITYTVASFRAIELTSTTVNFGVVRQGGVASQAGPTVLYGTTWTGDKVSVYLDAAMTNGVNLLVLPGAPTSPSSAASGDSCVAAGTIAASPSGSVTVTGTVTVTAAQAISAQPLVTGISNCGYPQTTGAGTSSSPGDYPTGTPVLSAAGTSWASFATTIKVDTTGASDTATPGSLATLQTKKLYFIIND